MESPYVAQLVSNSWAQAVISRAALSTNFYFFNWYNYFTDLWNTMGWFSICTHCVLLIS
jgi:hypothetical protein